MSLDQKGLQWEVGVFSVDPPVCFFGKVLKSWQDVKNVGKMRRVNY